MVMVDVVTCCIQADLRLKSVGWVKGRWPSGAVLHSLRKPGELSQWLLQSHVDSTINIILVLRRRSCKKTTHHTANACKVWSVDVTRLLFAVGSCLNSINTLNQLIHWPDTLNVVVFAFVANANKISILWLATSASCRLIDPVSRHVVAPR